VQAVELIKPRRIADDRGYFCETFNERTFAEFGIRERFVQDNTSLSYRVGTIRGLHFQTPPHSQAKLVRCTRGRIWDVVVDLRRGSPTYGQWVATELSAASGEQLFIPVGFAHGFCTLEPDTEVSYKVSAFYAPENDGGVRWDDPTLALPWPLPPSGPVLSQRDNTLPFLADFESAFAYKGEPLREFAT
jgi:dTDP-4-dehydrorhamnose 3,5-epimerase